MAPAFFLPAPVAADEKYADLAALGHGGEEPWDAPGAYATPPGAVGFQRSAVSTGGLVDGRLRTSVLAKSL